jgi:hypothetical protein
VDGMLKKQNSVVNIKLILIELQELFLIRFMKELLHVTSFALGNETDFKKSKLIRSVCHGIFAYSQIRDVNNSCFFGLVSYNCQANICSLTNKFAGPITFGEDF